jgi:thiol-disulfide isomerase/thioredoxin
MKNILLSLTIFFVSTISRAQHIVAYSADDVIHRTSSKDTVYIINFWATWCAPCVQELPEFNTLQERYAQQPVKVLLVSLDFKEDHTFRLEGFIAKKHLEPEVVWLSDTDPNVFIPKIEPSWEGSIPATVIVAPGKQFKKFIEGQVTERQVSGIVDKILAK